jgi:hypothetical protein
MRYQVMIQGQSPLLMHNDNLLWGEVLKAWEMVPANKKSSTPGDDRSPAWRWLGNCYHDADVLAMPSDNLMTMFREGGKGIPTGKRGASFKAATQSGILVDRVSWPLLVRGKTIAWSDLLALRDVGDFAVHEEKARAMGFELFAKRARLGQSKHVRVRPRFDDWATSGTVTILDDRITQAILGDIVTYAGAFCGLGDWRPSNALKSPGPFGRFTATIKAI